MAARHKVQRLPDTLARIGPCRQIELAATEIDAAIHQQDAVTLQLGVQGVYLQKMRQKTCCGIPLYDVRHQMDEIVGVDIVEVDGPDMCQLDLAIRYGKKGCRPDSYHLR